MDLNKLSGLTQMLLIDKNAVSPDVFNALTGQQQDAKEWYFLLRYYGSLEELQMMYDFDAQVINSSFAYILIDQAKIGPLSEAYNVIFIEIPPVTQFILDTSVKKICVNQRVQTEVGFNVRGKDVLIGIVDSGIDYFHKDFRNADGTTRIKSIWDQTQMSSEDRMGTVYSQEVINEALRQPTKEQALQIVPSVDLLGHGTALAGIAAGNGRGSNGRYRGVAPESDLIVVKANSNYTSDYTGQGPNIAQIMLGIAYILQEAIRLKKPVSILTGFGLNEGTHDGQNSLEVYMAQVAPNWKVNMVVGVGNEANKDSHASGKLEQNKSQNIGVFIDEKQPYYYFMVVSGIEDTLAIEIKAPNGESTGVLRMRDNNKVVQIGGNSILINFIGPSAVSDLQQINVLIDHYDAAQVVPGTWQIILYGEGIVAGNYNIWGTSNNPLQRLTRFLQPDPNRTVTIPATTSAVTSVGAMNGRTDQIANFSGRGYPLNLQVKPDVIAPGLGIVAPTSLSENGYASVSGTSAAAAFVAGAYALLLDYGLQRKPTSYLYGEALKSYIIKTATRPLQNAPYPNPVWGFGMVCVERALDALKEQYNL